MHRFLRFIRWYDWGPGKLPLFVTLGSYIGITAADTAPPVIPFFFPLFLLFAGLHSALGYVVNDWGDREIDLRQGKENGFAGLSPTAAYGSLAILFAACLLSGLPFWSQFGFLPLWGTWVVLTCGYSLKPLRLKERGAFGLGISAVAQWTLPVFLAFAAMGELGRPDMFVFALASSVTGATLELAHQRFDRARDLGTQTATFGTRISLTKLTRIYGAALHFDKLTLALVLLCINAGLAGAFPETHLLLALPLWGTYLALLGMSLVESRRATEFVDPYYSGQRTSSTLIHHTLPNVVLPGYLLLLLTLLVPFNAVVLALFGLWRLALSWSDWSWPLRVCFPGLYRVNDDTV